MKDILSKDLYRGAKLLDPIRYADSELNYLRLYFCAIYCCLQMNINMKFLLLSNEIIYKPFLIILFSSSI